MAKESLAKALKEFNAAMEELGVQDKVCTFTASDFARTLTTNGDGSDHGWGGNHIVMGGGVNGKQLYGEYPELVEGNDQDVERGRLIPSISCDSYFADLALWFGVSQSELPDIFPNLEYFYQDYSSKPVGFMP